MSTLGPLALISGLGYRMALCLTHRRLAGKANGSSVVVQFRQNLSGQPYVVARSEGRHVDLPLHRCGVEIKLNHYRQFSVLSDQFDKVVGAASFDLSRWLRAAAGTIFILTPAKVPAGSCSAAPAKWSESVVW